MSLILALGLFGKVGAMLCNANSNFTSNFAAIFLGMVKTAFYSPGSRKSREHRRRMKLKYKSTETFSHNNSRFLGGVQWCTVVYSGVVLDCSCKGRCSKTMLLLLFIYKLIIFITYNYTPLYLDDVVAY